MPKPTVRSAIVGSGFAASFHYEAVERVYGVNAEILGLYSPNLEKAAAFAHARGNRSFDSLDAMFEAKPDVIHVCAPPAVHEAITVAALEKGISAIVEKPFTGAFGDGDPAQFDGSKAPKQPMLDQATASIKRMRAAEAASTGRILYAENWVYAPAVQKEREIIEKTGAQILWMHGEEAHSGSHSPFYGYWGHAGGGAMIGKGCHPLTAALYLKRVEGRSRNGVPIRPAKVSGHAHALTRLPDYIDAGHLRTDYHDIEDFSLMHVTFEDGTIADIFASEIIMGGIHNMIEVTANNHRTVCNINPNTTMQTYNPVHEVFADIYTVEKIETKQGWSNPAPDEDHSNGFPQEMEAFYRAVAHDQPVESDSALAGDCISTIYAAYVSVEQSSAAVTIPL